MKFVEKIYNLCIYKNKTSKKSFFLLKKLVWKQTDYFVLKLISLFANYPVYIARKPANLSTVHSEGVSRGRACGCGSWRYLNMGLSFLWVRDVLHLYFAHTSKFLASKTIRIWPGCVGAIVFHGKLERKWRRKQTLWNISTFSLRELGTLCDINFNHFR